MVYELSDSSGLFLYSLEPCCPWTLGGHFLPAAGAVPARTSADSRTAWTTSLGRPACLYWYYWQPAIVL